MTLEIPETVDAHVIIQAQHSHRTWHAVLPNGKIVIAFINEEDPPITLEVGAKVRVCMTVSDFSRALIVV
ncbi:MAG: hypothetical protein ABL974_01530 [Prosthecobacter sp.]